MRRTRADPHVAHIEPLRFHDLRATFTTWAKRAGKGDGWIADRTGHLTPEMIQRYNRAARTLEDLRIEPFPELIGTIPELVEALARKGSRTPDQGPQGGGTPPTDGSGRGGPARPQEGADVARTGGAACAQTCDHAGLNVADGGVVPPENHGETHVSQRLSAHLKSAAHTGVSVRTRPGATTSPSEILERPRAARGRTGPAPVMGRRR